MTNHHTTILKCYSLFSPAPTTSLPDTSFAPVDPTQQHKIPCPGLDSPTHRIAPAEQNGLRAETLTRFARRKILTECQHIHVCRPQLPHGVDNLRIRFAESDHNAAFCPQVGTKFFCASAVLRKLQRNDARGSRTCRSSRGTHSTLCANTASGIPIQQDFRARYHSPAKSLESNSIVTCGSRS